MPANHLPLIAAVTLLAFAAGCGSKSDPPMASSAPAPSIPTTSPAAGLTSVPPQANAGQTAHPALRSVVQRCSDATLKAIPDPQTVGSLDVISDGLTDAGLAALARFTELRRLSVSGEYGPPGKALSGTGLASLGGLKKLRRVSLQNFHMAGPDGFRVLGSLPDLEDLDFSQGYIASGADLTALTPAGKLKRLRFSELPDLGDEGTAAIGRLPAVEELLFNTLADKSLAGLKGLTRLRSLSVMGPGRVSDDGLRALLGMPDLTRLVLNTNQYQPEAKKVTDAGLGTIAKLTRLQKLGLRYQPVTDAGLAKLTGLQDLEEIDLEYTRVTDRGMDELVKLPKLKTVWLLGTKVTNAGRGRLQAGTKGRITIRR